MQNLHSTLIKYKGQKVRKKFLKKYLNLHSTLIKYKVKINVERNQNDNAIYIPLWLNIKIIPNKNRFPCHTEIYIPLWLNIKKKMMMSDFINFMDLHSTLIKYKV